MRDTFHKKNEFSKFPWDKLDPEKFGKDWSLCKTGHGNTELPSAHCLYIVADDMSAEYWEMPEPMVAIIEQQAEMAERATKSRIRDALGL